MLLAVIDFLIDLMGGLYLEWMQILLSPGLKCMPSRYSLLQFALSKIRNPFTGLMKAYWIFERQPLFIEMASP